MDSQFHVRYAFALSRTAFSFSKARSLYHPEYSASLSFSEENCSGTVGGMKHLTLLGCDAWLYAPCHSCLKIIKMCYYVSIIRGLPCLTVT